jgi:uncharacterized protein
MRECVKFIPEEDFLPISLDEKIITYADNLIEGGKRTTGTEKIERLKKDYKINPKVIERMKKLALEIENLLK